MQDDGIHANLRYTQQAYVATVMKVTHAIFFCNFLIVNVLFLNIHIFAFPVITCNMEVEFSLCCVIFFCIRKLFKCQK